VNGTRVKLMDMVFTLGLMEIGMRVIGRTD
jgi:hypothetical protein